MAKLRFFATTIFGKEIELVDLCSYELSRDIDAACDGLRIKLKSNELFDELTCIKAYNGEELVFNGFVDVQRDSIDSSGREVFIFARSSACVLLDNEAEPRSYFCPTAVALAECNSAKFGFSCRLPMLYSKHSYVVNKGSSCFGAINNFVRGISGKSIIVNPMNEIILPDGNGKIDFSRRDVISERRAINRGNLISRIDYKAEGDNKYLHHIKSQFVASRGVTASKKINLSSLPIWQREYTAKTSLLNSASEYYSVEITVNGCATPQLYDKAIGKTLMQSLDSYYVTGVCIILDDKGERTRLKLAKEIDLEAITYVAEQGD